MLTSAQESIAWGQHPLGLAQAIFVVWQSDCVHFCTRIDCLGTASPWSSTSSLIMWQSDCAYFCTRIDCLGTAPLGLAQAVLVAWQSDCAYFCSRIDCQGTASPWSSTSSPLMCGNLIVLTSAQESIAGGQHPLGLAQAILVAWQSDCAYFCIRTECQGTASPWSSTSNP